MTQLELITKVRAIDLRWQLGWWLDSPVYAQLLGDQERRSTIIKVYFSPENHKFTTVEEARIEMLRIIRVITESNYKGCEAFSL